MTPSCRCISLPVGRAAGNPGWGGWVGEPTPDTKETAGAVPGDGLPNPGDWARPDGTEMPPAPKARIRAAPASHRRDDCLIGYARGVYPRPPSTDTNETLILDVQTDASGG